MDSNKHDRVSWIMLSTQDMFGNGGVEDWKRHLNNLHSQRPNDWADLAFFQLAQHYGNIDLFCREIETFGERAGWGSDDVPWGSLIELMRRDKWEVIPLILKLSPNLDLENTEIDHLAVDALEKGFWSHLDLLRPNAFLNKTTGGKVAHGIFKHNEQSYHAPLDEHNIKQLVQLPKHDETAQILGRQFAYTQRDPECFTDLDMPGTLSCLVIMVNAGWLDLGAAKGILEPRETPILERIARIENAVMAGKTQQVKAKSVGTVRRI
jgi:hypothetical protein